MRFAMGRHRYLNYKRIFLEWPSMPRHSRVSLRPPFWGPVGWCCHELWSRYVTDSLPLLSWRHCLLWKWRKSLCGPCPCSHGMFLTIALAQQERRRPKCVYFCIKHRDICVCVVGEGIYFLPSYQFVLLHINMLLILFETALTKSLFM